MDLFIDPKKKASPSNFNKNLDGNLESNSEVLNTKSYLCPSKKKIKWQKRQKRIN